MMWLVALWHLAGVLTEAGLAEVGLIEAGLIEAGLTEAGPAGLPIGLLVGGGLLLTTVLAAWVLLRSPSVAARPLVICRALRQRARGAGVPRHRDPDASGRARPRAPSTAPAVA